MASLHRMQLEAARGMGTRIGIGIGMGTGTRAHGKYEGSGAGSGVAGGELYNTVASLGATQGTASLSGSYDRMDRGMGTGVPIVASLRGNLNRNPNRAAGIPSSTSTGVDIAVGLAGPSESMESIGVQAAGGRWDGSGAR